MKNKEELKKKITAFRDKFKEYLEVCRSVWQARRRYSDGAEHLEKEGTLREQLTEEWGQLENIFRKIGAPMFGVIPAIGYRTMFFDEALSADFESPHKGDGLQSSISSATKAIGLIDALSDSDYAGLTRRTPILFLSHSFRKENEELIAQINTLLSSFPVSVVTGAKPATGSITEKVKGLVDDSNFILSILTRDEEQKDGSWSPSKWVYDEIAYVQGQKKPVIMLLEENASYKEGISGDAEYIRFNRSNLTDALLKLVTVLNSLLSK